ncbi:MAG: DUF4271 domain-containing protein [Rikenellaceae bacterium]
MPIEIKGNSADSMQVKEAELIFGTKQIATPESALIETTSWQPALSLLLITVIYCYGIFRYGVQLRIMVKNYWNTENTIEQISTATREDIAFLRYSKFLFLLLISTSLTVILCDRIEQIENFFFLTMVSVALISTIVTLLQKALNRIAGLFSLEREVIHWVRSYSNIDVAIFAYVLSPIGVITAQSSSGALWMTILLSIFYIFHILRSFIYLRKEKFYFSQWFLYLCGVEILPVMAVIASIKSLMGFFTT